MANVLVQKSTSLSGSLILISGVLPLLSEASAQLSATLTSAFGLSALQAELKAQLNASINLGAVSFDIAGQIKALTQLIAGLQAGVVVAMPTAALDVGLTAKIAGLEALIQASLSVIASLGSFISKLQAAASINVKYFIVESTANTNIGADLASGVTAALSTTGTMVGANYLVGFVFDASGYANVGFIFQK
jgi:hypothetical protein